MRKEHRYGEKFVACLVCSFLAVLFFQAATRSEKPDYSIKKAYLIEDNGKGLSISPDLCTLSVVQAIIHPECLGKIIPK
jgi:hypothetical protein